MLGHNGGAGRRAAGTYLVAQLVPSGGALDDDGTADGGQAALGAQVVLLAALELNASAPPRDESSESMSSSTAGRPGARRGAAGAAEGLCGAEALLPGGLSFRSPSSSDKRLSTSAILPSEHHNARVARLRQQLQNPKCSVGLPLSHKTKNPRTQPTRTCLFHSPPAAAHAGRREHLRRQLAMSSLAEQISQWESEERAYLVHQTRTRARQDHSQDPACSAREDEAFQLSATLSRTPAPSVARSVTPERLSPLRQTMLELADASGGRMLLPSPPRTPTSASSRRSLAEQGEAHSLRRRRMWEAEQQAKQDHAAVRPRQCTTQREYFGDFAVASSVQPAGGTHSCHSGGPHPLTGPEDRGNNFHQAPEDRAVCAALELAYADGDVFFTYGGTALHHAQSAPPLAAPQARLLRLLRTRLSALGSSALPGRGQPTGRPATASAARAIRLQSRRPHRL